MDTKEITTGSDEPKVPTPVNGYRQLTEYEISRINGIKDLGFCIELLEKDPEIDKRWLAIAKTDLQKGIMFLVRSIARPTTF